MDSNMIGYDCFSGFCLYLIQADMTMGNYQTGILEHGYKMKIAMDIISETIALGEKILLFR